MKKTLYEKAKSIPIQSHIWKTEITDEMLDLAIGWFENTLNLVQVRKVLSLKNNTNTLQRLAMILRDGIVKNKILLKKKNGNKFNL